MKSQISFDFITEDDSLLIATRIVQRVLPFLLSDQIQNQQFQLSNDRPSPLSLIRWALTVSLCVLRKIDHDDASLLNTGLIFRTKRSLSEGAADWGWGDQTDIAERIFFDNIGAIAFWNHDLCRRAARMTMQRSYGDLYDIRETIITDQSLISTYQPTSKLGVAATILEQPLFPRNSALEPELVRSLEHSLQTFNEDEHFLFWSKWLAGMISGRPLNWDLQRRVALIPDDIWDAGPKAVAEEIAKIEAQWLTEQAPLAETVALNPDTQKFHLIPTPVQNPPLTTTLVSRVQDALDDAMMGHNGLNERSTIARKLSRTCSRYADDPQRIEMDFTSAATSLRRQMYETHDLPDSEDNLLLLETVEEGVRGIRASHPDVAENRATLAGLAVQDLSEDDKATLAQAQPLLDAITEDSLQEDFTQDIPQLLNTSAGPLPNGAPPLPSVDASLRTFTRVSRIKLLIDKIGDWHDGKTHKAATMLLGATGIGKLLYELIQIGLKVLGVL